MAQRGFAKKKPSGSPERVLDNMIKRLKTLESCRTKIKGYDHMTFKL